MVPVYICEDNEEEKQYLKKMVANLILIQGYDMEVVLASNDPEEILQHRSRHSERAVYFFDVDLQNDVYNGFTLAKRIRELDTRGFLIFVTTHEEMMFETFKYRLEAMSYLIKDEPAKLGVQIRECLEEVTLLLSREKEDIHSYYTVKVGDSSYHIPVEDILYFETAGTAHRVILHTQNRLLEFRGDISTLEKELGKCFLKVHRSYLVNVDKIVKMNYTDQTIVMEDDSLCLFSRKGRRLLMERFER